MILIFGSINMDLIASVAAIPRPGETVLSPGYRTLFGGKGANQAVAAARASEGPVTMAGRVGRDGFGTACLANLRENGVGTDLVATGEAPTGCAFIVVDAQGENAITVASGANAAVVAADVPPSFEAPDMVALMQMEVPFIEALAVASRIKTVGGRVIWNFAPVPADFTRDELVKLLAATDIFVVNEHEARAASRLLGLDTHDIEQAASFIADEGQTICVVTAGADGAIACHPDGTSERAAALPVRPVDTTGAGDTFVGILGAELAANGTLQNALELACAGASLACLASGAQSGMPTRRELESAIPSA